MKGAARTLANAAAQEILIAHWQGIVKSLANFLNILKTNHVRLLSLLPSIDLWISILTF